MPIPGTAEDWGGEKIKVGGIWIDNDVAAQLRARIVRGEKRR